MFSVEKEIEVRYAETDQMGVVYHANYLVWLEIGRTSFISELGYSYKEMEDAGTIAPIIKVAMEYKKPAKYGDVVTVKTWIRKTSPFRTIYVSEIYNQNKELCLAAECEATCVDAKTFQLVSFKERFPEWFEAYRSVVVK